MAPVNVRRGEEPGKITIRLSTWLLPIILTVLSFAGGMWATSIRQQDKVLAHTEQIQELKDQKVSKEEFNAVVRGLNEKLDLVNRNVELLLRRDIHQQ